MITTTTGLPLEFVGGGDWELLMTRVGVVVQLHDQRGNPIPSLTGIVAMWWDNTGPTGDPVLERSNIATNAQGFAEVDLTGSTVLGDGGVGYLLLYRNNPTDYRQSLTFASRLTVELL
jgi:hypothetical protein